MTRPAVRKMWLATRENGRMLSFSTTKANNDFLDPHPVVVLDLRPEAMREHVEVMARALNGGSWTFDVGPDESRQCYYDDARAALSALLRTRKRR